MDMPDIASLMLLLPPGPERDKLQHLARVGLAFEAQQHGRKPGFIRQYVAGIVARLPAPVTFGKLLEEMELEAARRATQPGAAVPIETVNRVWGLVTYHHPRKGRVQVTFKTLRNHLTPCKKQCAPKTA